MANPFEETKQLHLFMGLQCHAQCIMCYQGHFSAKDNMPAVVYREHLAGLYPYVKHVKIQGGEPTIMSNCKDLVLFLRKFPGIKISLITNGVCIDEFWMETIINQGQSINLSVNAASRDVYDQIVKNGDFDRVIGNIRKIISRRLCKIPTVAISMVVLSHNIDQIADFITLGYDLGVDVVVFTVDPVLSFKGAGSKKKIQEELLRSVAVIKRTRMGVWGLDVVARYCGYSWIMEQRDQAKKGCPRPFNNLMVDQQGDVRACCWAWQVFGNTYRASLEDILKSARLKNFQEKVKRGDYSWCRPQCPDNPAPTKHALLNESFYIARRDPARFLATVTHKLCRLAKV